MRSIIFPLIPKKFLASQLRQPSGIFGKMMMGDFLNEHNQKMNHFAVEMLNIQSTDRVLEIGFGGGMTIESMIDLIDTGRIDGVDFSEVMVKQAKRKFKDSIESGKVSIECADVRQLPFEKHTFDKVCTVNTIYFWDDPLVGLREIKRVIKRNGKLIIGIRSAEKMKEFPVTQHNFQLYSPESVKHLLVGAGFNPISIDYRDKDQKLDSVMVIACAG